MTRHIANLALKALDFDGIAFAPPRCRPRIAATSRAAEAIASDMTKVLADMERARKRVEEDRDDG